MKPSIRLAVAVFAGLCAEFLTTQIAGIIPLFAEQNSQVSICDNITRGMCDVNFFRVTPGGVIGVIIGYAVCFRIFGVLAPIRTILAYAVSSATMWVIASVLVFTYMDGDSWLAASIIVAGLAAYMLVMLLAGAVVYAVYFGGKKLLLKAKGKNDDRSTSGLALPPCLVSESRSGDSGMKPSVRLAVAVFAGLCVELLIAQIAWRVPFIAEQASIEALELEQGTPGFHTIMGLSHFSGIVGVIIGYAVCFRIFGILAPIKTILIYAASSTTMFALTGMLGYEWPWFPKAAALFGIEVLAVSVAGTAVYFGGKKFLLKAMGKNDDRSTPGLTLPPCLISKSRSGGSGRKSFVRLAVAVFAGLCAESLAFQIVAGPVPFWAEQHPQVSICGDIAPGDITLESQVIDLLRVTGGGVVSVIIGYAVCFWIFGVVSPIRTILVYAASSFIIWEGACTAMAAT